MLFLIDLYNLQGFLQGEHIILFVLLIVPISTADLARCE
jgi:hypothetical protein